MVDFKKMSEQEKEIKIILDQNKNDERIEFLRKLFLFIKEVDKLSNPALFEDRKLWADKTFEMLGKAAALNQVDYFKEIAMVLKKAPEEIKRLKGMIKA